ncbi:MAG TPA: hypothetical protein VES20_24255 [Bryobacteraceae bacterium]|nr:hypothetical protein [Bryobacteraceae bacterium]
MTLAGAWTLLLIVNTLAGLPVIALFGRSLPASIRLALLPVLGTAVTTVLLFFAHLVFPLRAMVPWLPLVAAAAGLLFVLRFRLRAFPAVVVVSLTLMLSALLLAPFAAVGGPAGFGILNNDNFYWAMADWRVETASRFTPSTDAFQPLPDLGRFRRWGVNNLSTFLRSVVALRPYEAVQITTAFGVLLTGLSVWVLARFSRLHWIAAALAAVAAVGNHFVQRLLLDGFLGWCFGLSFAVAALALLMHRKNSWRQGVLAGVAAAALIAAYYDMLPVFSILAAAGLSLRWQRLPFDTLLGALVVAAPVALIVTPDLLQLIKYASGERSGLPYFRLSDPVTTVLHLTGAADFYQYVFQKYGAEPWQYICAGCVLLCLALCARWKAAVTLPVVAAAALAAAFLLRGQEYQAHRLAATSWTILPVVLFGGARHKLRLALVAVTAVLLVVPLVRLTGLLRASPVLAAGPEREVGSKWLRQMPPDGQVLIDVPDNTEIHFGHWLYMEAVQFFGVDDRRVVMPRVELAYQAPVTPPLNRINLAGVTHVLRSHRPGRVQLDEELIAQNSKYRFYRVRRLATNSARP